MIRNETIFTLLNSPGFSLKPKKNEIFLFFLAMRNMLIESFTFDFPSSNISLIHQRMIDHKKEWRDLISYLLKTQEGLKFHPFSTASLSLYKEQHLSWFMVC